MVLFLVFCMLVLSDCVSVGVWFHVVVLGSFLSQLWGATLLVLVGDEV